MRHLSDDGGISTCATPQGGVISPLLANLSMNRFLKHWRATGRSEAYQAHQDQGLPRPQDGAHHGFQAVPVGRQEVAPPGWRAPPRRDRSRRQILGSRKANRTRRLKPPSPTFDNSSPGPVVGIARSRSDRPLKAPPPRVRSWRRGRPAPWPSPRASRRPPHRARRPPRVSCS